MRWFSIVAIYFLFWFLSLFAMLPLGVRTTHEAGGNPVPGQADSAPHVFRPWTVIWRTTLCAAVLMAIFYTAYAQGWLDVRLPRETSHRIAAPPHP